MNVGTTSTEVTVLKVLDNTPTTQLSSLRRRELLSTFGFTVVYELVANSITGNTTAVSVALRAKLKEIFTTNTTASSCPFGDAVQDESTLQQFTLDCSASFEAAINIEVVDLLSPTPLPTTSPTSTKDDKKSNGIFEASITYIIVIAVAVVTIILVATRDRWKKRCCCCCSTGTPGADQQTSSVSEDQPTDSDHRHATPPQTYWMCCNYSCSCCEGGVCNAPRGSPAHREIEGIVELRELSMPAREEAPHMMDKKHADTFNSLPVLEKLRLGSKNVDLDSLRIEP